MKQLMENWRKYTKKDIELENLEEGSEGPLVQDAAKWMQGLPPEEAQDLVGLLKVYNETGKIPPALAAMLDDTPYDLDLNEAVVISRGAKKMLQILLLGAVLFAGGQAVVGSINKAIDQTASSVEKSIAPSAQLADTPDEGDFDR